MTVEESLETYKRLIDGVIEVHHSPTPQSSSMVDEARQNFREILRDKLAQCDANSNISEADDCDM